MNLKRLISPMVAAGWALALCAGPALANKMVTFTVAGLVTVAPSDGQIMVDGRRYRIGPQTDAAVEVASVHAGDRVELTLSGPATAASTVVVQIHANSNSNR